MRVVILFVGLLAGECQKTPPAPPAPLPTDAGPEAAAPEAGPVDEDASPRESVCARACARLKELGCKEGLAASCVATCERAQAEHLTDLHPDCLAAASTKEAARACKSVRCPDTEGGKP